MNDERHAYIVTYHALGLKRYIPKAASGRAASRRAVKYWLGCGLLKARPTIDHDSPSSFDGVTVIKATYLITQRQ